MTQTRKPATIPPEFLESDPATTFVVGVLNQDVMEDIMENDQSPIEAAMERAAMHVGNAATQSRFQSDAVLRRQFPNQYVAFVERWRGDEVERQILAHAETKRGVREALRGVLEDDRVDPSLEIRFFG